jgi:hypothetical protein
MTYLRLLRNASRVPLIAVIFTASAMAEWKAANSDVAAAAKEPKIASVLEAAVNVIDAALIKDDHAAFALCWRRTLWSTIRRIASRSGARRGEETLQADKLQQLCAVHRVRGDAWRGGIADGRRAGSAEG